MKEKWSLILLVFLAALLTACSSGDKKAPDAEIKYVVEEYLYENTMEGCIGSIFETIHNWDADSKTDSIQLKVVTEYEYGNVIAECECDFQYDKSSDLWSLKRKSQWNETIEYGNSFDGAEFEGVDEYNNIVYQIKVNHVDFEKEEIDWEWKINGTPSGDYPDIEIGKPEVAVISVHSADTYFVYTESGAEKYIPYFRAAVAIGSMRFTIDFTILGPASVSFWI